MTCPTASAWSGLPRSDGPDAKSIPLGDQLRYFGDGEQIAKRLGDRRFWRVPVMDGEFLCEDRLPVVKAIGGGNLIFAADTAANALLAAEAIVAAVADLPDVVLPFPGGVVRSGSKVGSRYPKLKASTNDLWCPTLRETRPDSLVPDGSRACYEIVIDGLSESAIAQAMRRGIEVLLEATGVTVVGAGNYGGRLGKHHLHLRKIMASSD